MSCGSARRGPCRDVFRSLWLHLGNYGEEEIVQPGELTFHFASGVVPDLRHEEVTQLARANDI